MSSYVWAPYIPVYTTPVFEPKKRLMSRYRKKVVNSNYYDYYYFSKQMLGIKKFLIFSLEERYD